MGKSFLKLIDKHFPKGSQLMFNRNLVKVSYSCMPNVASIKSNNKKVSTKKKDQQERAGKLMWLPQLSPIIWLTPSIIHKTEVKSAKDKNAKESLHKKRTTSINSYAGTGRSCTAPKYSDIYGSWRRRRNTQSHGLSPLRHAHTTMIPSAATCLTENLFIINADKNRQLNRRPELVSKCRDQVEVAFLQQQQQQQKYKTMSVGWMGWRGPNFITNIPCWPVKPCSNPRTSILGSQ